MTGRAEQDSAGRWWLTVARVRGPGGPTPAVLVALLDPAALQQVFDGVDTGTNGFVTLFDRQGWLLATAPRNDALRSRNWGDTPLFSQHLPRSAAGTVQQVVVRDGTERIYSWRLVPEHDLVVSAGISLTDALVEWRARLQWNALLLACVTVGMLALALAQMRQGRRREQAERALADSAARTRTIVEHVADGIVTFDTQGRIASANPAAQAMFGRDEAGLRGQPVAQWLPILAELPDTEMARREALARRDDGSDFAVDIAVSRAEADGRASLIALVRDITELQRTQAVVAEANARTEARERLLRELTDSLPVRLSQLDRAFRYQFVNAAYCERFGLPREQIIGRTAAEITGVPAPAQVLREGQRALAGERRSFEIEEVRNGQVQVIERIFVPDTAPDGSVRGLYAISIDVTERHRQQQRLTAALAERETLLREVYHRVKNNLQVIQSLLSLQRRHLPEGSVRAALDDSVQRVRAMALVHEKLYQAGTLASVPLADYTRDLLRQIAEAGGAHLRGIVLEADVAPLEVGLEGSLPYGLLVTELVTNSLKHGFADGRTGHIRVTLALADGVPVLRVADDGVSLPASFDLANTESLGLQLAASLATQLGGQLQAHDERGAVFSTPLPRLR